MFLSLFSDWIIFSSILCRADLAVFNPFSLSFSWRVFGLPSILTDSFDGHSRLDWQTQTLPDSKVFFSGPCGLKGFCWVTRCWSAFISDLTFFIAAFVILSLFCAFKALTKICPGESIFWSFCHWTGITFSRFGIYNLFLTLLDMFLFQFLFLFEVGFFNGYNSPLFHSIILKISCWPLLSDQIPLCGHPSLTLCFRHELLCW